MTEEDDRRVRPRNEALTPTPVDRASALEPALRAFLELSLGLPVFGMEVAVLDLLMKASAMPFGSLLLTAFLTALPFEAAWALLVLRRSRKEAPS